MGYGSNPSLQSLDQPSNQIPHQDQLTWQQQLLAQQQHPSAFDSSGLSGGRGHLSGGFQNHLGHHLPAVPSWQSSANPLGMPGNLGHFGQNAPGGGSLGLQGSFPMQMDTLRPEQGKRALNVSRNHPVCLVSKPLLCHFVLNCLQHIQQRPVSCVAAPLHSFELWQSCQAIGTWNMTAPGAPAQHLLTTQQVANNNWSSSCCSVQLACQQIDCVSTFSHNKFNQ